MEAMYQRSRIQEESLHYETRKYTRNTPSSGSTPTCPRKGSDDCAGRGHPGDPGGKAGQIEGLAALHAHGERTRAALDKVRDTVAHGNLFAELMDAVKVCCWGSSRKPCSRSAAPTAATCNVGVVISLWSGPRSMSTALMYSLAGRRSRVLDNRSTPTSSPTPELNVPPRPPWLKDRQTQMPPWPSWPHILRNGERTDTFCKHIANHTLGFLIRL